MSAAAWPSHSHHERLDNVKLWKTHECLPKKCPEHMAATLNRRKVWRTWNMYTRRHLYVPFSQRTLTDNLKCVCVSMAGVWLVLGWSFNKTQLSSPNKVWWGGLKLHWGAADSHVWGRKTSGWVKQGNYFKAYTAAMIPVFLCQGKQVMGKETINKF